MTRATSATPRFCDPESPDRRRLGKPWIALLCGSLALCTTATAHAGDAEREAAAESTFREGIELMKAGEYARACERLEASLDLDRGMGTEFRLAECYAKAGRIASAWKHYVAVADDANAVGMVDREGLARRRANQLEPRLSRLTIEVGAEAAQVQGLDVRLDDQPVAPELWNAPVPVDGGEHSIGATAPLHQPWSTTADVATEGDTALVALPVLSPSDSAGEADDGGQAQSIAGIVLGSMGLATMGLGVAVGLVAKSRFDDASDHCIEDACHLEGLELREEAVGLGNAATGVFIVGSALLAGGVVLWLTAPNGNAGSGADEGVSSTTASSPTLRVGVTPQGATVRVRW